MSSGSVQEPTHSELTPTDEISNQLPSSSASAGTPSGPLSMIIEAISKAIELAKNPVGYMTTDKDSPATTNSVMVNYVSMLAAIPFVAILIGDLWYYSALTHYNEGRIVAVAFVGAILTAIGYVVAVYIVGYIVQALAASFGTAKDQVKSLKLTAYIYTPAFLLSAFYIIPPLGFLTIIGVLYGLYILYMGIPIVLGTPKDRVVPYLVAIVVTTLVVYFVIAIIIGVVAAAVLGHAYGFM